MADNENPNGKGSGDEALDLAQAIINGASTQSEEMGSAKMTFSDPRKQQAYDIFFKGFCDMGKMIIVGGCENVPPPIVAMTTAVRCAEIASDLHEEGFDVDIQQFPNVMQESVISILRKIMTDSPPDDTIIDEKFILKYSGEIGNKTFKQCYGNVIK